MIENKKDIIEVDPKLQLIYHVQSTFSKYDYVIDVFF